MVRIADKHDRLVDMVQFDLLVGLWFEQIALPNLAALAFNGPGDFFVGDEKADLSLLCRNVAHKLEQ